MKSWSKGELGFMWLGIGLALLVTSSQWPSGLPTGLAVLAGAVATVYGAYVAWTGMRKDKSDDAPADDVPPVDEPGDDAPRP